MAGVKNTPYDLETIPSLRAFGSAGSGVQARPGRRAWIFFKTLKRASQNIVPKYNMALLASVFDHRNTRLPQTMVSGIPIVSDLSETECSRLCSYDLWDPQYHLDLLSSIYHRTLYSPTIKPDGSTQGREQPAQWRSNPEPSNPESLGTTRRDWCL